MVTISVYFSMSQGPAEWAVTMRLGPSRESLLEPVTLEIIPC